MICIWDNKHIRFGHNCCTHEAWFRPDWSTGDGREEMLLVTFVASTCLVYGEVAMYGCVAECFASGNALLEGNMSSLDSPRELDTQVPTLVCKFARNPKDPMPPWISLKSLAYRC